MPLRPEIDVRGESKRGEASLINTSPSPSKERGIKGER
jgi:hypothetical protein